MVEVLSNYLNKRLVFSVAQQMSREDYYFCVKDGFFVGQLFTLSCKAFSKLK